MRSGLDLLVPGKGWVTYSCRIPGKGKNNKGDQELRAKKKVDRSSKLATSYDYIWIFLRHFVSIQAKKNPGENNKHADSPKGHSHALPTLYMQKCRYSPYTIVPLSNFSCSRL